MSAAQAECKGDQEKYWQGYVKPRNRVCELKRGVSKIVRASKDARPDAQQLRCFVIVSSSAGFTNGEVPYDQTKQYFVHKIC